MLWAEEPRKDLSAQARKLQQNFMESVTSTDKLKEVGRLSQTLVSTH